MSYAQVQELNIVTDSSGDAEAYIPVATGKVINIIYTKPGTNPYDAGVDFTITAENSGLNLWTELNVNDSKTVAPRQPTHDNAGVASLFASTGEPVEDNYVLAQERVKIVIAQGGNAKTGNFKVVIA